MDTEARLLPSLSLRTDGQNKTSRSYSRRSTAQPTKYSHWRSCEDSAPNRREQSICERKGSGTYRQIAPVTSKTQLCKRISVSVSIQTTTTRLYHSSCCDS